MSNLEFGFNVYVSIPFVIVVASWGTPIVILPLVPTNCNLSPITPPLLDIYGDKTSLIELLLMYFCLDNIFDDT
jgi:hypothetical protein